MMRQAFAAAIAASPNHVLVQAIRRALRRYKAPYQPKWSVDRKGKNRVRRSR